MTKGSARFVLGVLSASLLLAGGGCSDGRDSAPVTGKVTLKGQPLEDIYVYFQPVADASSGTTGTKRREPGAGSYGLTDAEGNFTLRFSDTDREGAIVGTHTVRLVDKQAEGPEDADAGVIEAPPSRIPVEFFGRELTFEVKADGENQANFELAGQ